ncbi:hypothetical protein B14911_02659 [Bacillus sp. NRRL B-14911]|nr:hypothetical protein B14911_02659 [Bacillus sp. NRRL B-14911]
MMIMQCRYGLFKPECQEHTKDTILFNKLNHPSNASMNLKRFLSFFLSYS